MDRYLSAYAPGVNPAVQHQQSQYSGVSRPWHNPRDKAQTGPLSQKPPKAQNTQVDSWRSYKDDTTNLQSSTTPSSSLNAAALSFQPPQNGSYYKPYEPLRTSDGAKERQLIEQATGAQPVVVRRNLGRANRSQADRALPSIEPANLDYYIKNNSLNKALENPPIKVRYQRPAARSKTPHATASPPPPSTTKQYKFQAQKEPKTVTEPRKLLVILDLNGTLLYRVKSGTTKIYMRPGVTPLLDYLFSNHVVMVYTSTMPSTAQEMVNQFIHPTQRNKLAAVWARDKLDLNKDQYCNKVQVYKKLDKVWNDAAIQATAGPGNRWNQSNTILVDDSKLKALAQPHNLLQVLEYTREDDPAKDMNKASSKKKHKMQVDILKQLVLKLEELKFQEDVSRLIRKWQSSEIAVPKIAGQVVSVEEDVDQKKMQDQRATDKPEQAEGGRSQLLTPVSLTDGDTVERPMEISDDEDDGGLILSSAPISEQGTKSPEAGSTPVRNMLYKDKQRDNGEERRSSESSIDEAVFQGLLEGDSK